MLRTILIKLTLPALALSPDGRFLAVTADGVALYETASGRCIAQLPAARIDGRVRALAISPDGQSVLIAQGYHHNHGPADFMLWQPFAKVACRALGALSEVYAVAFSVDGALATGVGRSGQVLVVEVSTGRLLLQYRSEYKEAQALPLFEPAGAAMATRTQGEGWVLRDAQTGTARYPIDLKGNVMALLSSRGDALGSEWMPESSPPGAARLFSLQPSGQRQELAIVAFGRGAQCWASQTATVVFHASPNYDELRVQRFDAAVAQVRIAMPRQKYAPAMAVSASGSLLAVAGADRIWLIELTPAAATEVDLTTA